jgi:hypothetical protein
MLGVISMPKDVLISAQAVLNEVGLKNAARLMAQLAAEGFQTGPLVGNSFSITAPQKRFEEFFNVPVDPRVDKPSHTNELPLSALSPSIQEYLRTVLFTSAPDFGPTEYF